MCMQVLFHLTLTVFFLSSISAGSEKPNARILKECPLTEYKKFVECAEKLLLLPREQDGTATNNTEKPDINCDKCACQTCKAEDFAELSQSNCCQTCCPFMSCETKRCCFKTCHTFCETIECKVSCRQSCTKFIESQKTSNSFEHLSNSQVFNDNALNITTRINLTNVISNFNNITAPINLKSSNLNDVTIENQNSYEDVNRISSRGPCCEIVSPTKCGKTSKFPFVQCEFNKTSQCGASCLRNQLKIPRPPCHSLGLECGGLKDLYPIGYIVGSNKSKSENGTKKFGQKAALNGSLQYFPELIHQYASPQKYFSQFNLPSFTQPQMYANVLPRRYYNSYSASFPSNTYFNPNYHNAFISNPFFSSNMFYRAPPIYPPIFNNLQFPQMPFHPNFYTYPPPNPYSFTGMQHYSNIQPQFNYQVSNFPYQSSQISFPPIYTAFAPTQVVGEIMPNPTIAFSVKPAKNDAEILITNELENKESDRSNVNPK